MGRNGLQSCWSQLRQAVNGGGCNAWVWCGQPAGCNNGYGTVFPYQQCTLKFQPGLQTAKPDLNFTSKLGTSDFTSGWIREFHPLDDLSHCWSNFVICIMIASCSISSELWRSHCLLFQTLLVEALHINRHPKRHIKRLAWHARDYRSSVRHTIFGMPWKTLPLVTDSSMLHFCLRHCKCLSKGRVSDWHALHGHAATWSQPVDQTPSLPGYNRYTGVDFAGFFDYSW